MHDVSMSLQSHNMFKLTTTPLENLNLKKGLDNPRAGALTCFEGIVRNHNDGRAVRTLEYELMPSLCQTEAEKIIQEAHDQFDIIAVHAAHRHGPIAIGELAVWVGVTSAHRDDAFKACRTIIDEIKVRLPIWKKEHYIDGDSGWVNCQACNTHTHHQNFNQPTGTPS